MYYTDRYTAKSAGSIADQPSGKMKEAKLFSFHASWHHRDNGMDGFLGTGNM